MGNHPLSRSIAAAVTADPAGRAVEFEGRWHTWTEYGTAMDRIDQIVTRCSGDAAPRVGVLVRNRPVHIALFLALLRRGACLVVINPARGREELTRDVADLGLPLVCGHSADLDLLAGLTTDATLCAVDGLDAEPRIVGGDSGPRRSPDVGAEGVAIHMLTSGTTGPPKRIGLTYDALDASMKGSKHYESGKRGPDAPARGVAVVNSPLAHLGGVFRVLQNVLARRPFVFMEKFEVGAWVRAVRTYRPRTVSLVPAALRMVLEAEVDPADLAGLRAVSSGTAPLSPDDADRFTERFGVPVLVSYAATEFGGGVAGWTLRDHERYGKEKRGSVGRAQPGCGLRVVDEGGETVSEPDQAGLLEVRPAQHGPKAAWMRTNDLARIDADGFLYILGRADGAINRGGFKVLPEKVRAALERHPAVRGAVVFGERDARLGEVPVALVELGAGALATPEEIRDAAGTTLAGYERPTDVIIVPELPRTDSAKVDLRAARQLLDEARAATAGAAGSPWPSRWGFGLPPLPQAVEVAAAVRGLLEGVLSLDEPSRRVTDLLQQIKGADEELRAAAAVTARVRIGEGAEDPALRPYLDHAVHIGAYNPAFPVYDFTRAEGERGWGTVRFSLVHEGPPGFVHGGFLAVFFDSVMAHHASETGRAGKTKELRVRYRRPTPLGERLEFEVARRVEGRELVFEATLSGAGELLCSAEARAVAGRREDLPRVGERVRRAGEGSGREQSA